MASDPRLHLRSLLYRRAFLWVTLILFLGALTGHWCFGWMAYVNEQHSNGQAAEFAKFVPEALRDMFENWQAEMVGVAWQIFGLAIFYAVGSPQSREAEERMEQKVDWLMKHLDETEGAKEIERLDRDYARM